MIIDRFREIAKLDLDEIEYVSNDKNQIIFKNKALEKNLETIIWRRRNCELYGENVIQVEQVWRESKNRLKT